MNTNCFEKLGDATSCHVYLRTGDEAIRSNLIDQQLCAFVFEELENVVARQRS